MSEVRKVITKSNKDYDLVLTRLYLYYDMKLVTFGIDKKRNLIVQFPVFVQPYTQHRLIMYQIETVPVPILDQNEKAQSYTQLKIDKPYIALDTKTYITLRTQELHMCKKIPFLHTLVTIEPDNTFSTTVCRKRTHTDHCLHWDSNHHITAKQSVYNILAHRAQILSSTQGNLDKEL